MKPPSDEAAAVGPISVYWDIKKCPVPDGYDGSRVGPCICGFLRKLGYSGPITITAVGVLSEVPEKILETVSSSGISLFNGPYGRKDMIGRIFSHSPPYNIMVISRPGYYDYTLSLRRFRRINIILPSPLIMQSTSGKTFLWQIQRMMISAVKRLNLPSGFAVCAANLLTEAIPPDFLAEALQILSSIYLVQNIFWRFRNGLWSRLKPMLSEEATKDLF